MAASPWGALWRDGRAAYSLLLILSVGIHAIDIFIITTVLPSVVADIGGAAFYTCSALLYVVASILGTACGSLIRARYDLRRAYTLGTLVFLLGTLGCALAPRMVWLLLARTVQGCGGGMLLALSYAMVSALYTEPLRPHMFSLISGMWGIAALLGPSIGGLFATLGWWRGAFWGTIPVISGLLVLAWSTLPTTLTPRPEMRFPWLRLLCLGTGVLGIAGSGQVSLLWQRLGLIAVGCILMGLTFWSDGRARTHMFPSRPLSLSHLVGTAYWMLFLLDLTSSQVTVFMPLVVQVLHGVSPMGAGYFAALRSLAWTAAALASAGLQGRWVGRMLVLGPLMITCGIIGQAVVVVDGSLWWLGVFLVVHGAGIGLCFAHLSSWTIAAARAGEAPVTSSAIATMRALGQAFGAATAGVVANLAGLAEGVSLATVAPAATWVYGLGTIVPVLLIVLAWRLLWLHRQAHPSSTPVLTNPTTR